MQNEGLTCQMSDLPTNMKTDEVSAVIKSDETILLFGQTMMFDRFNDTQRYEYHIRERLRELGKLLLKLCEPQGNATTDLKSFIDPGEWDFFCDTVKSMTISEEGKAQNTLSLKLGHSVKKCCVILWGQAMRKKDEEGKRNAKGFEELYKNEWSRKVSSRILKDMKDAKLNKKKEQPLDGDIQ